MSVAQDEYLKALQAQQDKIASDERARVRNTARFVEAFLTIGPDCSKLETSNWDAQILEAKAKAAARWHHVFALEAQVLRDQQALAARRQNRPDQPGDRMLADEVVARLGKDWTNETEEMRKALKLVKEEALRARKELETYIVKTRG
jgi:hypothetical protein